MHERSFPYEEVSFGLVCISAIQRFPLPSPSIERSEEAIKIPVLCICFVP